MAAKLPRNVRGKGTNSGEGPINVEQGAQKRGRANLNLLLEAGSLNWVSRLNRHREDVVSRSAPSEG